MEILPIFPKDVYEYLANFADDKTIVNMLSVNKKFNDPVFFERIFKRKYPLLIAFKKDDETWKQFYLKMVKAISLLKEKYDFPYIASPNFNPNNFPARNLIKQGLFYSIEARDLDLIKHFKKGLSWSSLLEAIKTNDINVVQAIVELIKESGITMKNTYFKENSIKEAQDKPEILKYLLDEIEKA